MANDPYIESIQKSIEGLKKQLAQVKARNVSTKWDRIGKQKEIDSINNQIQYERERIANRREQLKNSKTSTSSSKSYSKKQSSKSSSSKSSSNKSESVSRKEAAKAERRAQELAERREEERLERLEERDFEIYMLYQQKVDEYNSELLRSLKKKPSVDEIISEHKIASDNAKIKDEPVEHLMKAAELVREKMNTPLYLSRVNGMSGRQELWQNRMYELERIIQENPRYWQNPKIQEAFPNLCKEAAKEADGSAKQQISFITTFLSTILGAFIWWYAISGFWAVLLYIIILVGALFINFMMYPLSEISWKISDIADRYKRFSLSPWVILVYIICAAQLSFGLYYLITNLIA